MSDESVTPDQEELAAALRMTMPDGTDWAQVVRDDAAWAAFSQTLAAVLAPDFVYEDDILPDHVGETYQGLDGLRRASAAYVEPFEELIYELERVVRAGDSVVSIHRVRAKARHTGIVQDVQAAYIWTFRGGRLVHLRAFLGADDALRAAGLRG